MRSDALANCRHLVAAASRLVAEQGPDASLRAVAQAAGVGVGTLYRHFPSRRALLTAVLERVVERLETLLRGFVEGTGPVAERWEALARGLAAEDLASLLAAQERMQEEDAPPAEAMGRAEDAVMGLADRAVDLAREAGLVGDDVTGRAYMNGLIAVTRPPLPALESCRDDLEDWLLTVFLRGLRPAA